MATKLLSQISKILKIPKNLQNFQHFFSKIFSLKSKFSKNRTIC